MTDTGLNRRLSQHSRRSGFAVGLTMFLTTGLMIALFIGLFAWLNPYLSDFISSTDGGNESSGGVAAVATESGASPLPASVAPSAAPTEGTQATEDDSNSTEPEPPESDFVADYQSSPDIPINLRSAPGTNGTQILEILDPGTPLLSLGQSEVVNGVTWIEFQTEDGQTGWIREIDAVQIET